MTTTDRVRRNVWLVRAAALGIFLLGFAAGALAPAAYRAWAPEGGRERRAGRFERMSERLDLTPEQRAQVQQIFGQTRSQLEALRKESEPRVAEIRRQADERIRGVLTPEQWEKFRQERDEPRRRGGRRDREGGDSK
ncbi:MAG TPA: Spy/CpxP family protein refolding chaperone [Pyrinomonadaceae bacterium]